MLLYILWPTTDAFCALTNGVMSMLPLYKQYMISHLGYRKIKTKYLFAIERNLI